MKRNIAVYSMTLLLLFTGCKQENSMKLEEDDMINYYTIDDFHTIVVGKSTYEELREVSIRKGVEDVELISTAEGFLFRFPMENGEYICVNVSGSDSIVRSIEIE